MATFFFLPYYGNFFVMKKSCHFEKLPFWGLTKFFPAIIMATFFVRKKSCHFEKLPFLGLGKIFLAIVMASYFGMRNYGSIFVKIKWQGKCYLKRLPSFKTLSEHSKCPVVDGPFPHH